MDAGDWVAVGAAVIAFVAMLVSSWQAREAARARRASEDQAASSWRAANAAEFSAHADQAQLQLASQTQHDLNAPRFVVRWESNGTHNEVGNDHRWEHFQIKCLNSPRPLERVRVTVQARRWADLLRSEDGTEAASLQFEDIASGRVIPIEVRLIDFPHAQVILEIESWRGRQHWVSYEFPFDTPGQHCWRDRPR